MIVLLDNVMTDDDIRKKKFIYKKIFQIIIKFKIMSRV